MSRLAEILGQLDPDDRAVVEQAIGVPAWQRRQARLAARDAAIREAAAKFFDGRPRARSEALATALRRYVAGSWRFEQRRLPQSATARHRLLHRIVALNGGAPVGWRRIFDIVQSAGIEPAQMGAEIVQAKE